MPYEINKETGYLEAVGQTLPRGNVFDSEKKKKFLDLSREYVLKHHNFPPVHEIAPAVGIGSRTFYIHLNKDDKFKEDWKEIQSILQSHFTQKIGEKANTKQGTLANIAALRYLETNSWNPNQGLNPVANNSPTKTLIEQFPDAIDAEIVPEPKQLPENRPQENHLNE